MSTRKNLKFIFENERKKLDEKLPRGISLGTLHASIRKRVDPARSRTQLCSHRDRRELAWSHKIMELKIKKSAGMRPKESRTQQLQPSARLTRRDLVFNSSVE